ncbi:LytR C-terminal domain-containing protein [uncultured Rothia sp.]|uniref:LytR C-terminal domain-containing protein n=1 Tax=uncultured Rothia sp. TaxID=316088 RepID=UPI002606F309|nr:LytR C-terminal domain-containing protein [uncultured Rothia sp.]
MSYPRDEFDEVDENTARRGTYRAVNADPAKSPKGAIPLVAAGVVGLLVGGAMYVYAPRTASPQYSASTAKSSSAPASASASSAPATASASPTKTGLAESISVAVYNAAAPAGSASGAAALLTGYTISETANYTGVAPATSVVYYAEGYQSQAQSIASKLGITQVRQATSDVQMGNHEVIVILSSDYTGSAAAAE